MSVRRLLWAAGAAVILFLGSLAPERLADLWLVQAIPAWLCVVPLCLLVVYTLVQNEPRDNLRDAVELDTARKLIAEKSSEGILGDQAMVAAAGLDPIYEHAAVYKTSGLPVALKPPIRARLLVLGGAGYGKTTLLARLASYYMENDARIVVYLKLGAWGLQGAKTGRSRGTLEGWLVSELRAMGVKEDVAEYLVARESLILVLDGLNELPAQDRLDAVGEINALLRVRPQMGIIVSCVTDDYEGLSMKLDIADADTWVVPRLATKTRRKMLAEYQIGAALGEAGRADLEAAIESPFMLRMAIDAGEGIPQLASSEQYTQFLISNYVISRTGIGTDLARFGAWLASWAERTGTTFDLQGLTPSALPLSHQSRARRHQTTILSVPMAMFLLVIGVRLHLGVLSVVLAVALPLVYRLAGASNLGEWLEQARRPAELVYRMRWVPRLIPRRLRFERKRIKRRFLECLIGGLGVGFGVAGLNSQSVLDLRGSGWWIWLSTAVFPIVALATGGVGAGLVGGMFGAALLLPPDTARNSIIAGLFGAGCGFVVFLARDLGERVEPYPLEVTLRTKLAGRVRASFARSSVAEIIWWWVLGLIYGWITFGVTGNISWLWNGFQMATAASALFVVMAGVGPIASTAAVSRQLRSLDLLGKASIDEQLDSLIASQLVTQTPRGSCFRFTHPLIQAEMASSLPDGKASRAAGSLVAPARGWRSRRS